MNLNIRAQTQQGTRCVTNVKSGAQQMVLVKNKQLQANQIAKKETNCKMIDESYGTNPCLHHKWVRVSNNNNLRLKQLIRNIIKSVDIGSIYISNWTHKDQQLRLFSQHTDITQGWHIIQKKFLKWDMRAKPITFNNKNSYKQQRQLYEQCSYPSLPQMIEFSSVSLDGSCPYTPQYRIFPRKYQEKFNHIKHSINTAYGIQSEYCLKFKLQVNLILPSLQSTACKYKNLIKMQNNSTLSLFNYSLITVLFGTTMPAAGQTLAN